MKLSELEGKRVAIWGYGHEGRSTLAALRWRLPRVPLALLCSASEAAEAMETADPALYIFTEEVTADLLARFDVVIKSPGISPYHGVAAQALARGVTFTSGTALWFSENPGARTICVTGTKGKSTTTALIAHLLRAGGVRTALAGNPAISSRGPMPRARRQSRPTSIRFSGSTRARLASMVCSNSRTLPGQACA